MIKIYYILTKPGIIMGNIITTFAGFILAAKGEMHYGLLLATLLGLILVIASACVFNNYLDRFSDEKMARTKNRALVQGLIPHYKAIAFAISLGIAGSLVLFFYTNLLTLLIALAGLFIYVILYTLIKYHSTHATLIGSVAGAVPPLVGYCAVSNRFDLGASLLFALMVFWQMPHFFAIAIYRLKDYAAASIPVLPVKKGMRITKIQMVIYVVCFLLSTFTLTYFKFTGLTYLVIAALLGVLWLLLTLQGFKTLNDIQWARRMFIFSLIVITLLCVTISVEALFFITPNNLSFGFFYLILRALYGLSSAFLLGNNTSLCTSQKIKI